MCGPGVDFRAGIGGVESSGCLTPGRASERCCGMPSGTTWREVRDVLEEALKIVDDLERGHDPGRLEEMLAARVGSHGWYTLCFWWCRISGAGVVYDGVPPCETPVHGLRQALLAGGPSAAARARITADVKLWHGAMVGYAMTDQHLFSYEGACSYLLANHDIVVDRHAIARAVQKGYLDAVEVGKAIRVPQWSLDEAVRTSLIGVRARTARSGAQMRRRNALPN